MNQTLQALEAQLSQTQALSEKLGLLDQLYQFLRVSDLRRARETLEEMLMLSQNPSNPTGRGLALKTWAISIFARATCRQPRGVSRKPSLSCAGPVKSRAR